MILGTVTGAGAGAGSGCDASTITLVIGARANHIASPNTSTRGSRLRPGTRDSEGLQSHPTESDTGRASDRWNRKYQPDWYESHPPKIVDLERP